MNQKLGNVCIATGVGLGVGVVLSLISREHYRRVTVDAIEKEYDYWRDKLDRQSGLVHRACEEVRWLRNGIAQFCGGKQAADIFTYVNDNTIAMDEKHPEYRQAMEHKVNDVKIYERESVESAEDILEDLGYKSKDEPRKFTRVESKPTIEEMLKARITSIDDHMAESEYPGEEVGAERLAPNGDILDEAWDPKEEYTDEDDKLIDNGVPNRPSGAKPNEGPYIISEFDFSYTCDGYEKVSIEYYAGDDTLVDDDESIMDEHTIAEFIKKDNLRAFTETEEPSIFILNDRHEIDYEILWNNTCWDDDELDTNKRWLRRPWED